MLCEDATDERTELVVLDPFYGGRLLSPRDLRGSSCVSPAGGWSDCAEHLMAASPSATLVRMLTNLRGSYARRIDGARFVLAGDFNAMKEAGSASRSGRGLG